MKKQFALALTLAAAFGCMTMQTQASEKTSVSVIAAQYGNNTAAWWADFEKDFEADNPDIDLVVEVVSWNDIYTKVNTLLQNDQAPDVLNIDTFADYYADDLLLPAKDYVSEETYAKYYEAFLGQSEIDGTVWAVPDLASVRTMFFNKDLLEEAGVEVPATWDELKEACKALKDFYGDEVYPWGIDMTTDEGQAAFAYYTWNNGGGFVDENGDWALNSDANVEAVEFEMSLYNEGYTNSDPANQTRYDLQDLFGQGKLAMMIGPNGIPTYLSDGGYEINYGIASIPSNTGDSIAMGVMDRFMCFDNGYSEEELAAVTTFFDYFFDDERYAAWVKMEDFLPATSTGAEAIAAMDESYANWIDILGTCQFYPTAKTEWIDVKQGSIDVEQQALLGEDVRTLLDALQEEVAG